LPFAHSEAFLSPSSKKLLSDMTYYSTRFYIFPYHFGNILFSLWSKAIKRTLFLEYQRKAPISICKGDDLTAFALMLYKCNSLLALSKTYYHYRVNSISIMHSFSNNDITSLVALYEYLLPHCKCKYHLNLERCVIQMMLEHIAGVAIYSDKYKTFKIKIQKIFDEPLFSLVQSATTKDLRIIDKFKLFSLKHNAKWLYWHYKYANVARKWRDVLSTNCKKSK
jgi:hypothetical protein